MFSSIQSLSTSFNVICFKCLILIINQVISFSKSNSSGSEFSSFGPLQKSKQSIHLTGLTFKLHAIKSFYKASLVGGICSLHNVTFELTNDRIAYSLKSYEFMLSCVLCLAFILKAFPSLCNLGREESLLSLSYTLIFGILLCFLVTYVFIFF